MTMTPFALLWRRVFYHLGYKRRTQRVLQLDEDLIRSLRAVAAEEGRTEEEVAVDMIVISLAQRDRAVYGLERWRSLSPREQEIAALVCLNYTNRQIAARLYISPETVKTHVKNSLYKFGLRRKEDLRSALSDWDFSAWK